MTSSMADNGSTKSDLQKTACKFSRSWTVVSVFLAVTFVTLLGYTLMHSSSWAKHYGVVDQIKTGVENNGIQSSPAQPSLPASLATLHSNQWDVKIESLMEKLTFDRIAKLTYAVPGIPNQGAPEFGIKPFTWNLGCYHGNEFSEHFPASLALAASFSSEIIHEVASSIGTNARIQWESKYGNTSQSLLGFVCFAPNVNLMRDPRWSGNMHTLGEDPLVISTLLTSYITGLHGNSIEKPRIMTGCRFMSVFSGPENSTDLYNFDVRISLADLYMTYLKPYEACVEAGSLAIMCSHHRINGIPSCAEYNQLSVELRHNWHYKGIVISDVDAVRHMMTSQKYRLTSPDAASSCIAAGCNFELTTSLPGVFASQTISLANGTITESQIRENVKPILYTSLIFDQDLDGMTQKPTVDEEQQLQIKSLMKSFVLLKNDGLLPLKHKYKKLAIIGPAGSPLFSSNGTALHGLSDLAEKWSYVKGCLSTEYNENSASDVMDSINAADIIIITLSSCMNFTTKSDYLEETTKRETEMLNKFLKKVKPSTIVIVLLFMASPVDISLFSEAPKVSVILECFQPVNETGVAIYRTLVNYQGQGSPGGRLPFTWPRSLKDLPKPTDYSMKNRTYRYNTGEPLYPFGYGLSYSRFEYFDLKAPPQIPSFSDLPLSFTLTNTGQYDADEVIQVYIKWRHTHVRNVPRIQLVHFERIFMKSGQSRKFTLKIPYKNFAIWTGHKQGYTTIPVAMTLYIGGQQPDQKVEAPSNVLSAKVKVSMVQNLQQPAFV